MKQTLLELTQDILSSMDADEVTSITDTIESEQVATIIKQVYYDVILQQSMPEHWNLFNLATTSDSTPTVLTRPSDVLEMKWFQYNKRTTDDTVDVWEAVQYMTPEDFLLHVQGFDQSADNVTSFTLSGDSYSTTIYIQDDKAPDFWTSFDDYKVVCDSYDAVVDTTGLIASKSNCYGRLLPTWTHSDSFTPDLDTEQFRLLYNEAKALAWAEMKQTVHGKAEKKSRQHQIQLLRKKQDLPNGDSTWKLNLPNYGRRT